ncbi:UNVERIFIED_CONTAM: hypothetical protein PYX00_001621 [Menopon gallinae]|uniref:Uncharacterized protein n=1 Tax=Menopon gallinae TaxID=328185 RepID=A0AAW2IEI4_9NEOP
MQNLLSVTTRTRTTSTTLTSKTGTTSEVGTTVNPEYGPNRLLRQLNRDTASETWHNSVFGNLGNRRNRNSENPSEISTISAGQNNHAVEITPTTNVEGFQTKPYPEGFEMGTALQQPRITHSIIITVGKCKAGGFTGDLDFRLIFPKASF